jgi:cell division protein FtsI (penicillin-binding protein 3)
MSLAKILAVSSNVGASTVAERLGGERITAALDSAGFFAESSDGVIAAPSLPSPDRDPWQVALLSMGGGFRVSPLRVVAAYSAFGTGGEVVSPRLYEAAPRTTTRLFSPGTAETVTRMMESVVATEGTGSLARVADLRIAGKTGTADLDGTVLASFVGVFPAEAPRWVLLVGAETRSGTGGETAAPRFAELVRRAFR